MNLKTSQDDNRSDFVHFHILGSCRKRRDWDLFSRFLEFRFETQSDPEKMVAGVGFEPTTFRL